MSVVSGVKDFRWHEESTVVFPTVYGVAVYSNEKREIVVRQQADAFGGDDLMITIPVIQAEAVANALLREVRRNKDAAQADPRVRA
jgi:hypothetical protein